MNVLYKEQRGEYLFTYNYNYWGYGMQYPYMIHIYKLKPNGNRTCVYYHSLTHELSKQACKRRFTKWLKNIS